MLMATNKDHFIVWITFHFEVGLVVLKNGHAKQFCDIFRRTQKIVEGIVVNDTRMSTQGLKKDMCTFCQNIFPNIMS